eukprot:489653-Prymnesium_polylepis.1
MPSAKGMPKDLLAEKKKCATWSRSHNLPTSSGLDQERKSVFVSSKVRDAVVCDECGRPRLIYSMKKPLKKEYDSLTSYKET